MRAKITAVTYAARQQTPKAWQDVVNAVSGIWGWTQTTLSFLVNGEIKTRPVVWRVSPGKCETSFILPADALSLVLPFALPSTGGANPSERPTTIVHEGGFISAVDFGGWTSPETCDVARGADEINDFGTADDGDRVSVQLFLPYSVED